MPTVMASQLGHVGMPEGEPGHTDFTSAAMNSHVQPHVEGSKDHMPVYGAKSDVLVPGVTVMGLLMPTIVQVPACTAYKVISTLLQAAMLG